MDRRRTRSPRLSAGTTTTAAATTTTEPEPEPVDHGQQFLEIVDPVNCAILAVNDAWAQVLDEDGQYFETDWPIIEAVLLDAYIGFAETYERASTALVTAMWPEELQVIVDDVAGAWAEQARVGREVAAATSFAEFEAAIVGFQGIGSAGALRDALDLPPPDPTTFVCDDPSG